MSWDLVAIVDTADIINEPVITFEGERPYVATGNLSDCLDNNLELVTFKNRPSRANLTAKPGDILIARMQGTTKVLEISDSENNLIFSTGFIVLRAGNNLHSRYLYHYLGSETFQNQKDRLCTGATQKAVNNSHFKNLQIPLPPLPIQQRIADILDKADALRRKDHELLKKYDELAEAIFVDMFGDPVKNEKGWELINFNDILDKIEGGWSPVCYDRPAQNHEWGVLKLGAITKCVYDDSEQKALPKNIFPREFLEIKKGDLLFSRKNTYDLVAACALVKDTRAKLMFSDLMFRLILKKDSIITQEYLQKLLTFKSKRASIQRLAGGSSGSMPNISKEKLKSIAIEVPPLSLQKKFTSKLIVIDNLIKTQKNAQINSTSLFQSLLYQAFNGGLII